MSMFVRELSEKTGIPASTIREYETGGLISPSKRLSNGYRVFEVYHIPQLYITKLCFKHYINRHLRQITWEIISGSAAFDFDKLFTAVGEYITTIDEELRLAYEAADILGRFITDKLPDKAEYTRTEAARLARVSPDAVRGWERNGLIGTGTETYARIRLSKADVERMKLIRFLLNTGYGLIAISAGLNSRDPLTGSALLIDPATRVEWLKSRDSWVAWLRESRKDAENIYVKSVELYNLSITHHI